MSTDSLSPQYDALLKRVEAIEKDAQAMKDAHSQSRVVRLLVLLLLLVAAVVFVYLFVGLAMRFADSGRQRDFATVALNQFFEVVDSEKIAQAEEAEDWDELLNQYSGILAKEAENLGKTSMPVVQAAFRDQMNKDMSKHRAMFNEQRDLLVKNVQDRGEKLLQARYEKILDQHRAILQSEFENLDDEKIERMLAHFSIAVDRLLRKYYRNEIEAQMNELKMNFDQFPVVESPVADETLQQQLLGTTMELLRVKLAGEPISAVDTEISAAAEEKDSEAIAEVDEPKQDPPAEDNDASDPGESDPSESDASESDAGESDASESDAGESDAESESPEATENETNGDDAAESP